MIPLCERVASSADDTAIDSDGLGRASWAEVGDVVLRLAERLRHTALGDHRSVVVIARNRPATIIVHAAALLGVARAVPVNFHLTAPEIAYQLNESGAQLVFADSTTVAAAQASLSEVGHDVTIVAMPNVGVISPEIESFIGDAAAIALDPHQRVLPSLLFTSGTTGRPKAVQLPPKTIGSTPTLAGFDELIRTQRMARFGTHLVVGPLYHNGPLTAVRLLLAGVPLVVHGSFDAQQTLAAIERYGIASSVMVPTHFVRCLALPAEVRARYDLSTLQCIVHTGGACPVEVKHQMLAWWGPVLYESYGGTESGSTCSISPQEWLAHPGSVGRAVAPFQAVIIDDQGNEVTTPDVEGRLYFRDTTGRGIRYEGDEAKTAAAHIAPGVFTLGEIGKVDADGFVYITDRFSDMVVSGGVNIYPAEAEQALISHPAVVDAACIGLPDNEMGERLVAVVQAEIVGRPPTAAELIEHCRSTLAGYKCPKEVRFVVGLGRNAMGKLDKRALKKLIQEQPG